MAKIRGQVSLLKDGDSGIIISEIPPENPEVGQLWQTASGAIIKRWDGSTWAAYYLNIANLDVETLSAITANLGEVTAGIIKGFFKESWGYGMYINLNTGELFTQDLTSTGRTLNISKGVLKQTFKDGAADLAGSTMDRNRWMVGKEQSTGDWVDIQMGDGINYSEVYIRRGGTGKATETRSIFSMLSKPTIIAPVKTIMQDWDITFKKTDMREMLVVYAIASGYRNQILVPADALNTLYAIQVPWQDGHTVTMQLRYEAHPTDLTLNRIYVVRLVKTGAWASTAAQLEVRTI